MYLLCFCNCLKKYVIKYISKLLLRDSSSLQLGLVSSPWYPHHSGLALCVCLLPDSHPRKSCTGNGMSRVTLLSVPSCFPQWCALTVLLSGREEPCPASTWEPWVPMGIAYWQPALGTPGFVLVQRRMCSFLRPCPGLMPLLT